MKLRKKVTILSLLTSWSLVWLMVAAGLYTYSDKILNYVPRSHEYLINDPSKINPAIKPNHVVMIGIDGVGKYTLNNGFTPNMDYLMHHGAYAENATDILPSSSNSNWASLMYGNDPIKNGVVDQELWNIHHTASTQVNADQVSIFDQICPNSGNSPPSTAGSWFGVSSESAMFYNWKPKDGISIGQKLDDTQSLYFKTEDDAETYKTVPKILDRRPVFSFFYFVNPDIAGHSREWNSPEYNKAISITDNYVGGIISYLDHIAMLQDTIIIISSDHGGVSQYHGHNSNSERNIPLIIYGPSLPVHGKFTESVLFYDITATILWLLSPSNATFQTPNVWDGQPVLTPFFAMYNMYDHSEDV